MSLSKDRLLVGWGEAEWKSAEEIDSGRPAFYFSDFFLTTSRPWIQYVQWNEISKEDLDQALGKIEASLISSDWTVCDSVEFKQAFEELQLFLREGRLQKGVPYVFARSSRGMTQELLKLYLKEGLASLDHKSHLYAYWNGSGGILGITPELLFSHSEHQPHTLHTMALAGTYQSCDSQESFLENEKERHEHELVVQGICQSLETVGSIKIGSLQVLALSHLMHLMTPIEAQLRDPFDFEGLVRALHPTPALGAFPVKEGKRWLENYEKKIPRGYYGSPIGFHYFPTGLSQCLVGIRNVQWDPIGMKMGAGCGVVRESTFEQEWEEIHVKIQAIRAQFHL